MTDPHHETALMLLRAAGFDVGDGENILFSTNVEWRLIKNVFLAMAAAVDAKMEAREKVLREAAQALIADCNRAIWNHRAIEVRPETVAALEAALEAKP